MYVYLDDARQLGLDCVTLLSARRGIVFGWTMVPRGTEAGLDIAAGDTPCAILHTAFHPRPDIPPADPRRAVVTGFTLVFELPEATPSLTLTLTAGEALLRADMRDPQVERSLAAAMAARSWRLNLDLLRQTASVPALAPLLTQQGRPFGVFADWLAAMPVARGRAANHGRIAETECLAAPSGELLVMLRAEAGLPPEALVDAAAIGWLRGGPGSAATPCVLPLAERHAARLPAALAFYARLAGPVLDRLQAVELVVLAEPEPGEEIWLRCQPSPASIPDLLDAACRATATTLAVPVEAAGTGGLALLGELIARREAAFLPVLGALAGAAEGAAGDTAQPLPRTAVLLGADDPLAARLLHVTAPLFARHCDTLLVLGGAADDVAQAFAATGRPAVLVGEAAARALRAATGLGGVLALDAPRFAEAVIADRADAAFAAVVTGPELARVLALHTLAGSGPALSDSLRLLLRGRAEGGTGDRFPPLPRLWGNRHAATPVHAHLERMWACAATAGPASHA